jgi:hypothetical protein
LISLVSAIAERLGIETADAELPELKRDVHPEQVLDKIEETERNLQPLTKVNTAESERHKQT